MKKTFFIIALAAVAFVGCQKEKGMVTINLAGENYVSADKQAYYNIASCVYFSDGDGVYLNGGLCPVTLSENTNRRIAHDINDEVAASPVANLAVLAEYMHAPAISLYPASIFTPGAPFDGTATDISDWTVTMKENLSLINTNNTVNIVDELTNGGVADKPVWPMYAYTPSLNNHVQLKNCVALLSPAVYYGDGFVLALSQNSMITETVDPENLPILKIDSVVISSTTNILAGQGHIDLNTVQNDYPVLVMDETADASYRIVCKAVNWNNGDGYEYHGPTNLQYVPFGHVPVAPYINNGDIKAVLYFTLTFTDETSAENTYYCKYEGGYMTVDGNHHKIRRSERTTLAFNLLDDAAIVANKITVSTTPLN